MVSELQSFLAENRRQCLAGLPRHGGHEHRGERTVHRSILIVGKHERLLEDPLLNGVLLGSSGGKSSGEGKHATPKMIVNKLDAAVKNATFVTVNP